ncbi:MULTISPECIES: hypothetical protein [unclassified Streptomyces]
MAPRVVMEFLAHNQIAAYSSTFDICGMARTFTRSIPMLPCRRSA